MQASSLLFSGPWQAAGKVPALQGVLRSDAGLSRPDLNPGSLTPRPKSGAFGVRRRVARAQGRLVHFRGQVGTKPRRIGDSAGICLRSDTQQNKNLCRSRTCRITYRGCRAAHPLSTSLQDGGGHRTINASRVFWPIPAHPARKKTRLRQTNPSDPSIRATPHGPSVR